MNEFHTIIHDAFSALLEKYNFSPPEFEKIGRESYAHFHRNGETISISQEPGAGPLIELFLKCEGTSEQPLPWAERNGVERYRKFPQVGHVDDFYTGAPKLFEEAELGWLTNQGDD